MRKNLVNTECKHCSTSFQARPDFLDRGEAQFCSRRCSSQHVALQKLGLTIDELKENLVRLISKGLNFKQISLLLEVKPTTVSSWCTRFGIGVDRKTYDWAKIEVYYHSGKSFRECAHEFGLSIAALSKALKSGRISRKPRSKLTYLETARRHHGKRTGRNAVRQKILEEKLIAYKCAICSISEWNGKSLTLRLDHIDGDGRDHSLENLRFVCPNCDSQLPTYGHRNRGRYGGYNLMAR